MRNIKFRGKETDTLRWLYGDFAEDIPQNLYYIMDKEEGNGYEVIQETVGQYTGLKDKNGKEIYEGDIIYCKKYIGGNWIGDCIEKGYVNFNNGEFGLYRKQGYYQSLYKFKEYDYEFEVIGNIYDNPELLEEKE